LVDPAVYVRIAAEKLDGTIWEVREVPAEGAGTTRDSVASMGT